MSKKKFAAVAALGAAACLCVCLAGAAWAAEYEMVDCHKTETKECAPGDLDATKTAFPKEAEFSEDGIEGKIPLKDISVKECYQTMSYECNRTATYTGLPSNEVTQIPETSEFTDDDGFGCTLALAGLSWEVTGTDSRGIPNSYTATAIYRGTVSHEVLSHYEVTATWEGQLPGKEIEEEPAIEPEPAPAIEPEPEKTPVAPIAAAAAAAAAVGAVAFFRRRPKFTVVGTTGGAETKLCTVKAKKSGSGLRADIPAPAAAGCYAVPSGKKVAPGTEIAFAADGRILYDGPVSERMVLAGYGE